MRRGLPTPPLRRRHCRPARGFIHRGQRSERQGRDLSGALRPPRPASATAGASSALNSSTVTKTNNSHVRRLLDEAAGHHRPPYRPSTKLQRRWQRAPGPVVAHAAKGNRRLHARWRSFDARRKRPVVANLAIARELAGWCHALAVMDPGRYRCVLTGRRDSPRPCRGSTSFMLAALRVLHVAPRHALRAPPLSEDARRPLMITGGRRQREERTRNRSVSSPHRATLDHQTRGSDPAEQPVLRF